MLDNLLNDALVNEPRLEPHIVKLGRQLHKLSHAADGASVDLGALGEIISRVLRSRILVSNDRFGDTLSLGLWATESSEVLEGNETPVELEGEMGAVPVFWRRGEIVVQTCQGPSLDCR